MLHFERKQVLMSVFFMVLASAFVAGSTIIAKTLGSFDLGDPLSPFQISHSRFLFAFIFISIIFFKTKSNFEKPSFKLHLARTMSGWVGVTILFGASSIIPVADAIAINFTNPIFAMLLAVPFLKERLGLYKIIAVFVTFLGAIILIRPSYNFQDYEPVAIVSLIGAVILGLEAIFIKLLIRFEHHVQILFINNAIGLLISTIPLYFVWKNPTGDQIKLCVMIGMLMLIGQFCFLEALKRAELSFVAPFFYNTLIFVIIFDYIIYNSFPDNISLLGSAIIIIGGIIVYWKKNN
tara:strand:+ start:128 stop:1006 length:879 start_codon:yes stop_codon:yes gene_type:complete